MDSAHANPRKPPPPHQSAPLATPQITKETPVPSAPPRPPSTRLTTTTPTTTKTTTPTTTRETTTRRARNHCVRECRVQGIFTCWHIFRRAQPPRPPTHTRPLPTGPGPAPGPLRHGSPIASTRPSSKKPRPLAPSSTRYPTIPSNWTPRLNTPWVPPAPIYYSSISSIFLHLPKLPFVVCKLLNSPIIIGSQAIQALCLSHNGATNKVTAPKPFPQPSLISPKHPTQTSTTAADLQSVTHLQMGPQTRPHLGHTPITEHHRLCSQPAARFPWRHTQPHLSH